MPSFISPDRNAIHTDTPLTNISIAFFQDASNFIANQVFPTVPVTKSSNIFYTIPRGEMNRLQVKKRGRGAKPATMTHLVASDNYNCDIYALAEAITDEDRADQDAPLSLDTQATQTLTTQGLINREVDWTNTFFATSIWGTDIAGVASSPVAGTSVLQWNDAGSDPIENIHAGMVQVLSETGFEPNTLVLGYEVYNALQDHPDIIDRIKYGQTPGSPAIATEVAMAQIFGVERILVSRAIRNTAAEGATDSHSFVAGKAALLCYVTPTPGIRIPTAGYTFGWNVYSSNGMRMRRFRDEEALSDKIIMDDAFDQKLIAADLGYFWSTIVA